MDQEQTENLATLEEIMAELWRVADKFNKAGYKATAQELHTIDNIAQLTATIQKLARL